MCGIAGFFTGCPFKDQCSGSTKPACKMEFSASKAFANWYKGASVRDRPRRILDADDASMDLFPRHLVPVVSHSLIAEKYMENLSYFLCLQLHRYLDFTVNLELSVVNPSILEIVQRSREFQLSHAEILALHQMYVDEGYHAQFCVDMSQQVLSITGVSPEFHRPPAFLDALARLETETQDPLLARLIFTAVSETLITGNLRDVATERGAPPAIRELMRDHAADEGRHHVFFKEMFVRINSLDPIGLRRGLELVPKAILAFLEPDRRQILSGLVQSGVSEDDAEQIVSETYTPDLVISSAQRSARDLLVHLQNMEIGTGTRLNDELAESGLLV